MNIPAPGVEFTGKFIKAFLVYLPETNVCYYREIDIFIGREDAKNCIKQLPSWQKSEAKIKIVMILQIGNDYIFLEKMRKAEIQPIGSVPYLGSEEIAEKRRERISNLIRVFDKKMSKKSKPKLTKEEIDCLLGGIGQSPE